MYNSNDRRPLNQKLLRVIVPFNRDKHEKCIPPPPVVFKQPEHVKPKKDELK